MRVTPVTRVVAVIAFASLTFGCTSSPGRQVNTSPTPVRGGTVTLPIIEDPENLNPYLNRTTETVLITKAIFQDLVDLSPTSEYTPVLAAELPSISTDGKVVTWKLKKGVVWSDGAPFTSADVTFTAELLIASLADAGLGWEQVSGVSAPDDYTVIVTYTSYYPAYLDQFSGTGSDGGTQGILSKHACATDKPTSIFELPCMERPVGTGPFTLASWQRGKEVVLERNAHFAGGDRPYLDKIVFPVVPTMLSQNQMLLSNQAQALWNFDFHASDSLRGGGADVVASTPWVSSLTVNLARPVGSDPRVRKALSAMMDRESIVKDIFASQSRSATTDLYRQRPTPAGSYDPAAAKTLLDSAGWTTSKPGQTRTNGGRALRFSLIIEAESAGYQALAQYIQSQLKSVDVAVDISIASNLDERILKGDYDLALREDGYVGDPGAYLERCYLSTSEPAENGTWDEGWNVTRYANPEFDSAIKQAQAEPDRQKRQQLLLAADAIVERDAPVIFLATYPYPNAYSSRLHGWAPNINNPMTWDVDKWYLN